MTDWVDRIVSDAKEKYKEQRLEDERFVRDENLKKELGAQYFRTMETTLQSAAAEFNEKFGAMVIEYSGVGQNGILLTAKPTRTIRRMRRIAYNETTQQIMIGNSQPVAASSTAVEKPETIQLVRTGDREMVGDYKGFRLSAERLCESIMHDLAIA